MDSGCREKIVDAEWVCLDGQVPNCVAHQLATRSAKDGSISSPRLDVAWGWFRIAEFSPQECIGSTDRLWVKTHTSACISDRSARVLGRGRIHV